MEFTRPTYIVPRRFSKMFVKGEIVHKISYASLTGRWVSQQLFPFLDMPQRSYEEIRDNFLTAEKCLFERCKFDSLPRSLIFVFRSTWQDRLDNTTDPFIHELIAVIDKGSFVTAGNLCQWWEFFNLPIIIDIPFKTMKKVDWEFTKEYGDSHGLYVIDRHKLYLYHDILQFGKDWRTTKASLGLVLYDIKKEKTDAKVYVPDSHFVIKSYKNPQRLSA